MVEVAYVHVVCSRCTVINSECHGILCRGRIYSEWQSVNWARSPQRGVQLCEVDCLHDHWHTINSNSLFFFIFTFLLKTNIYFLSYVFIDNIIYFWIYVFSQWLAIKECKVFKIIFKVINDLPAMVSSNDCKTW